MLVADFHRFGTTQEIDEIRDAKSLVRTIYGTQGFLCDHRAVKLLKYGRAVIAITAIL